MTKLDASDVTKPEPSTGDENDVGRIVSRAIEALAETLARAFVARVGASVDGANPIEVAIAEASRAGQWDVVAQLARELEARRLADAGNVVPLAARQR